MIQDIYPHHLENRYCPEERPDEDSILIHFNSQGQLLLANHGFQECLPTRQTLKRVYPPAIQGLGESLGQTGILASTWLMGIKGISCPFRVQAQSVRVI